MNLLGFGTVIVHFLIISHSYRLICKGQIKAKELYVFGAYTLLVEAVLELTFYFLSLDGLGIVTFLFPLGLYSYFRWIKQYESCLLYTSPSPRDATLSRMPSSA